MYWRKTEDGEAPSSLSEVVVPKVGRVVLIGTTNDIISNGQCRELGRRYHNTLFRNV